MGNSNTSFYLLLSSIAGPCSTKCPLKHLGMSETVEAKPVSVINHTVAETTLKLNTKRSKGLSKASDEALKETHTEGDGHERQTKGQS